MDSAGVTRASEPRIAIAIDLAFGAFVLVARGGSGSPGVLGLVGSLAIAAAYCSPALLGLVALRGRPAVFVAAGLLASALSVTAFSLVTLVLLPAGLLFFAAASPVRVRPIVAPAIVAAMFAIILGSIALHAFGIVTSVPAGLLLAGLLLLGWHVVAARSPARASVTFAGVVAAVALGAAAWAMPVLDTTTVCWSTGGSVPLPSATSHLASDGSVHSEMSASGGSGAASGCDSGVPTLEASGLGLALLAAAGAAALAVPSVRPPVSS